MNCEVCGSLLEADGSCRYCERAKPSLGKSALKSCLIALLVVIVAGYFAGRHYRDLQQRSGIQWDEQMAGPWARQGGRGVQIYRIHIVDRQDQSLDETHRSFKAGDKLVANFHFRSANPGRFQPRLLLTGPTPIQAKEHKALEIGPDQFRSCLIPVTIPPEAEAGKYVLSLELHESKTGRKAFWETDIQVQKP